MPLPVARDPVAVRHARLVTATIVLPVALAGCRPSVACRGNLVPALQVSVLGAGPVAVCSAVVRGQDGRFETSLTALARSDGSCVYVGPTERRGSYTVTATEAGLTAEARATVGFDGCHVETARLTLSPA